jgi:D-aminopeptidase
MDAPAPGDWTLAFKRDEAGNVTGMTVGCWLARKIEYKKV